MGVGTHSGDGAGVWATLDGYVGEALKSGALVRLLEDWCEPFPGPFLYYPSRRQTPPAPRHPGRPAVLGLGSTAGL